MVHFTDVGPMTSRDVFSHYCNFTFVKFGNFGIFLKTAVLCRLVQTWYIWLDKSRTNKLDLVLVVMSCMLCHLTYVILLNQFDAIKHISDFEPILTSFVFSRLTIDRLTFRWATACRAYSVGSQNYSLHAHKTTIFKYRQFRIR